MLIHREALELANLAADEGDERFALTAIEIRPDGRVSVTDGHMWLRVSGKVEEPSLFDALIPAKEREQETTILLPAEAAQSFNAALKKRKVKKGEAKPNVVISQTDKAIRLASSDGRVTRRFEVEPPTAQYPALDKTLKDHVTTKKVVFSVELLSHLLRTMRALGSEAIHMEFAEGELAPVRISGLSVHVGEISGALMPMKRI